MALTMSISFWAQPCLGYPSCTRYSADLVADSCPACLSCRSDSNGEDLEGYAGAGLYESITMDETQLVRVDYNDDPITSDSEFRRKVRPGVGLQGVGLRIPCELRGCRGDAGVVGMLRLWHARFALVARGG
jgi:hypothetical protein